MSSERFLRALTGLALTGLVACAHLGFVEEPKPDAQAVQEALEAERQAERCKGENPPKGCPRDTFEPMRYVSSRAWSHAFLAELARRRNDAAGVVAELREALVYDPESSWLRTQLAEELAHQGRVADADEEVRRVLSAEPGFVDARLLAGRIATARLRPSEARAHIQAAIDAAPERPEPWREKVRLELAQGEMDAALQAAESLGAAAQKATNALRGAQVLDDELDPFGEEGVQAERLRYHAVQAWLDIAKDAMRTRQDERVQFTLSKALMADPVSAEAVLTQAQFYESRARFAEGLEAAIHLLGLRPDAPEVVGVVARLSLEAGDFEGVAAHAHRLIEMAVDLEPIAGEHEEADADDGGAEDLADSTTERAQLQRELASLLIRVGAPLLGARRPALALQLFEAAQRLLPGHPEPAFYRALALEQRGRAHEAHELLEGVALALDGKKPWPIVVAQEQSSLALEARVQSALARGKAGDPAEAVKRLQKLFAEQPADDGVALGLLEALDRQGRAVELVAPLVTRVGEHPDSPGLLYALGSAQERAGRPDEALSTLKRLLKQDPDNAAALNHVGYALVEKADAQSLEQAEPMLRRAVELRPDDGAVADSYGLCLLRRGRIAQALPELKRADALSPGDPIILSHLGDAQLASGLRAEAEETFKRSLSRLQPAASKRRSKKLEPQVDGEGDPDRAPDVQDAQVRVQLEAKLRALKSPQP